MLLLQGSPLRRNLRWLISHNQRSKEIAAIPVVDTDHLSTLPDELILDILTKLDPEALYHCIAASPRFLQYLSKIPSYSTELPSKLIVHGSPRPLQTLFKYSCCATGLVVLSSPLLYLVYFLLYVVLYGSISRFYGMLPYSSLLFLTYLPPIRRRLGRCCFLLLRRCVRLLLRPLPQRLFSSIFRTIRYVVFHPVTTSSLCFLGEWMYNLVLNTCVRVYSPRVSNSGRRFLKGLTGISSIEATLPGKVFDHPDLWVRGEKQRIGNMTYDVLITGRIANANQQQQEENNGNNGGWVVFGNLVKDFGRQLFDIFGIHCFVRNFPVPGEVMRVITTKNNGTNMRIRFDLKESTEEKKSLFERVRVVGKKVLSCIKEKLSMNHGVRSKKMNRSSDKIFEFNDLRISGLTLEEGSVVLQDVQLYFECCCHDVADGATTPDVKDLMWAYLDDDVEKQQCESDTVRTEIKEVVRFFLTTEELL